jgi:hypothetical protein
MDLSGGRSLTICDVWYDASSQVAGGDGCLLEWLAR